MSIPNRLLLDISSNNSSSNLDRIAFLSSQLQRFTMDDIDLKEDEHHLEDLVYKLYKKLYVASARNVHYTLEPQGVCIREDNIKLIIFVHTSPQNVEQRTSIRETWAQKKILHQYNYKIVFVTGFNQNMSMSQLSAESEQHKDLLLVDFVDSYHNLTFKALSWQKWVLLNCNHIKYVLKTDDDVFINISMLDTFVKKELPTAPSVGIWCNLWNDIPVRQPGRNGCY